MGKGTSGLTREIISTCMELESVEIGQTGMEIFDGERSLEIQAFNVHVVSSERFHTGFQNIINALFGDELPKHNNSVSAGMDRLGELLKSGRVTLKHLQVIEDVCRQFFFLGWHARHAVESRTVESDDGMN